MYVEYICTYLQLHTYVYMYIPMSILKQNNYSKFKQIKIGRT